MLYSNKIKPYSFVNPNLISVPKSGMASAVKSSGGIATTFALSSKKTLLGLNRLGASLHSLGETQRQIRDVISIQLKSSKDVSAFKIRRQQYLRDQESERRTELAGEKKVEQVVNKDEIKKEGESKLSWLEKLLGPFRGIVEFAIRAIITQGVLRWVSDPKNGERLQKIVSGFSKFFGFVFGIVTWSIDSFMSGVSSVFGDGSKGGLSRFAEVLGGLGQILVGIAGLKAVSYLLNPFSLISDILGILDVLSSKDSSGGDLPTDKPSPNKPGRTERSAISKLGRKALVGTLGKSGTKTALTFFKKTVSPILKRIPIIGGLIDFAINVFVFKESPGKAAFKAIGAGLLGWIGGALGSVIPGPGTFVGALLGGMAGDALGGLLYDAVFGKSKKDDEPALAEGGLVTKPTRALIGERGPELILPLGMLQSASGTGQIIATLSSALTGALSAMGSSGELAKLVIADDLAEMQKLAAGARPAQPGESLGKSVVKVSSNIDLQLGDGSEEFLKYIGEDGTYTKNSPRTTLRGTLANILGIFETLSKKSFRSKRSRGQRPGSPGPSGGGMLPGDAPPIVKAMLDAIAAAEGGWDSVNPGTTVPGLSKMTIAEARRAAIQKGKVQMGGSGAMGKWQQMPAYILDRARDAGLDPNKDIFNQENQTKIARMLMASVYPGGEKQLVIDAQENPLRAAANLRGTWPSLPGGSQENAHTRNFVAHFNNNIKKYEKMSKGGKVKLSRGGKLTLGPSKMGNGYENIRDFFESQQATAAGATNAFSKISSDIGKLNSSVVSTEQVKAPPKINIPELTKKDSVKVPPAPKNVNISASSPSSTDNIDKLSTIAAAMEEDSNTRMALIPIPTPINNSSASVASPRPKVVRARTPITYGF